MAKDFDDDDDRPRPPRKPPGVPPRSTRRDDDDEDDRPRSRNSDGGAPKEKKSAMPLILGIILGIVLICGGGAAALFYLVFSGCKSVAQNIQKGIDESLDKMKKEEEERKALGKKSSDNLVKIGEAVKAYESANNDYPTNSLDATGRPLLSWRVHILPYLGHDALYKKFKLNEPWDSPANKPLIKEMPAVFAIDGDLTKAESKTHYRGFEGPEAVFERRFSPVLLPMGGGKAAVGKIQNKRIGSQQITDGTSVTILCVEARDAVDWTKPDDLSFSKNGSLPSLGKTINEDYRVLMLDGGIKTIPRFGQIDYNIKAAITIAGAEATTLP